MAGDPVKFRCYRCNGLLGVSHSKVGSIVACPKCRAELVVPSPEGDTVPGVEAGGSTPPEPPSEVRNGGISFEFLDIRPEDIRVEPGAEAVPYSPPRVTVPPAEDFPRYAPAPPPPAPPPYIPPEPVPTPELPPAPEPRPEPAAEVVIPPIRLDGPRSAPSSSLPIRSRDIVLPRSAVASWSLFVLIAQGLAFLAGLLAGHFLWRVH